MALHRHIGRGCYGTVYREYNASLKRVVAAKRIVIDKTQDESHIAKTRRMIEREESNWKALTDHELIRNIPLYKTVHDKDKTTFYTEYCERGDVANDIMRMSPREQLHLLREVCLGVKECHDHDICHGDVKAQNILFANMDDPNGVSYKLCDYGCSSPCESQTTGIERLRGTPYYMAPEVVLQSYGKKSDVWSIGILAYHLFTKGKHPYITETNATYLQCFNKVLTCTVTIPEDLPPLNRDLLSHCLERNKERRFNVYDLLDHPLLKP